MMEFSGLIHDQQLRNVTSLSINNVRKEVWVGCKDGTVKGYDLNTKKLKFRSREHSGVVVQILCWHSQRLMITIGIDGAVIFWSAGALATDKVFLGEPLYNAVIYAKKHLVLGTKCGCKYFLLDSHRFTGHYLRTDRVKIVNTHKEMVRSLAAVEGRLYSGSADGAFTIYEQAVHLMSELHPTHSIRHAHAAGISCIEPCRNAEEDDWLVATGSYDQHIKVWTNEGQLVHVISICENTINNLVYIGVARQLWVAYGGRLITIVDPKTGEDLSEWMAAWQKLDETVKRCKIKSPVEYLYYSRELEGVVALTDMHYILHWTFNVRGAVLCISCPSAMESIAFTASEPLLFFTGDSQGHVLVWESAGFNTVKFAHESLVMQKSLRETPVEWQRLVEPKDVVEANMALRLQVTPSTFIHTKFYPGRKTDERELALPMANDSPKQKMLWIEELDLLAVADERGVIYIWGFEESTAKPEEIAQHFVESSGNNKKVIENLQAGSKNKSTRSRNHLPKSSMKSGEAATASNDADSIKERLSASADNLTESISLSSRGGSSGVSDYRVRNILNEWTTFRRFLNRASGMSCRFILWGHDACVSSLEYVYDRESSLHALVSAGWDRRIVIWNLQSGQIVDTCKRSKTEPKVLEQRETPGEYELVAEGQITCIAVDVTKNLIGYSSRDAHIYVRQFSSHGRKMKLMKRWHAHNGEVLQIKWMPLQGNWVSSGQDGTVRIWSGDELGVRMSLVHHNQTVQCLAIDKDYGWILAGVGPELHVLDPCSLDVLRVHSGHQQAITGIVHVHHLFDNPYYVTSSYDGTIQIWTAYRKPRLEYSEVVQPNDAAATGHGSRHEV
ncbi:uncharacterized protein LOC129588114 [Paramacrobiotus metropolitanus]|uniref:uncharacterized protein LOC129588114 n=1 Tax=Paramacrobiotus metropolitanus TaxID=2943436 RepID=UPI002445A144|nr:uncharacterized protein LOC129588114 [Paramacrobiotus metropolitanus]